MNKRELMMAKKTYYANKQKFDMKRPNTSYEYSGNSTYAKPVSTDRPFSSPKGGLQNAINSPARTYEQDHGDFSEIEHSSGSKERCLKEERSRNSLKQHSENNNMMFEKRGSVGDSSSGTNNNNGSSSNNNGSNINGSINNNNAHRHSTDNIHHGNESKRSSDNHNSNSSDNLLPRKSSQYDNSKNDSRQQLVDILSRRALPLKAAIRKVQKKCNKPDNPSFSSTPFLLAPRDHFYMPKVSIVRSDGTSLLDIHDSKQKDEWSAIIRAEEKINKAKEKSERHRRLMLEKRYGDELELQNQELQKNNNVNHKDYLGQDCYVDITAKKLEDNQIARREEMKIRQIQFLLDGQRDKAIKDSIRENEILLDYEANTAQMNKNKYFLAMEEKKIRDKKTEEKRMFQVLTMQNEETQKLRRVKDMELKEEDRQIMIASSKRQIIEEGRRRAEFERLMAKTAGGDGPVHRLNRELLAAKVLQEERMFSNLLSHENVTDKQMKYSEEVAKYRATMATITLKDSWNDQIRQKDFHNVQDKIKEQMICKSIDEREKMLEEKEYLRKKTRKDNAEKYKKQLDAQWDFVKKQSRDSLAQTMTQDELKINSVFLHA